MALITASDTFDEEELEPEDSDALSPLIEWLNSNNQNIVNALQGGLGDRNFATQVLTIKADSNVRKSVQISGQISTVVVSRVVSQADGGVQITGFNWWPTTEGFDFQVTYTGENASRDVILRVDFDV